MLTLLDSVAASSAWSTACAGAACIGRHARMPASSLNSLRMVRRGGRQLQRSQPPQDTIDRSGTIHKTVTWVTDASLRLVSSFRVGCVQRVLVAGGRHPVATASRHKPTCSLSSTLPQTMVEPPEGPSSAVQPLACVPACANLNLPWLFGSLPLVDAWASMEDDGNPQQVQ